MVLLSLVFNLWKTVTREEEHFVRTRKTVIYNLTVSGFRVPFLIPHLTVSWISFYSLLTLCLASSLPLPSL